MNALTLKHSWSTIDWKAPWPHHLRTLGLCIFALLILFSPDVVDMAAIWWNVSTYTHCLFIIPIAGWLISQRMDELARLSPRIWWPGLLGAIVAAVLWALGEAAGLALFRHAALVLMMQSAITTILGRQILRVILFPVIYLSFLVPVGEELVPLLQTITAKLTVTFLGWSGIPHSVDGVFIRTPAGLFEVAEACSGVKFLIAMAAYATLAAHVCFKSWKRRVIFLAFGLIVPVIANGVRAFGTIWISGISGIEFAASFDHVIYGWFFFGFVMILIMGCAWPFFDRNPLEPWVAADAVAQQSEAPSSHPVKALLAILGLVLFAILWQFGMDRLGRQPVNNPISMPQVSGWQQTDPKSSYPWVPRFVEADHRLDGQYRNAQGQRVDLVIALYGAQHEGKELIGFGQGSFDPESEWSWTRATPAPEGSKADVIFAPGAEREVIAYYVMNGKATGSGTRVKVATLKAKLTGGDQSGVAILISAQGWPGQTTRPAIDAFLRDLGPVEALADKVVRQARGN